MKVLHAAVLLEHSAGIVQQMDWEQRAARELNISWDVRIFSPCDAPFDSPIFLRCESDSNLGGGSLRRRILARMKIRRAYFSWLSGVIGEYDLVLLRHNVYSFSQILFLCLHREKVITVHHTLEVAELLQGPKLFRRVFYSLMERILGRCSISLARGVLGVTGEILRYEQGRSFNKKKVALVCPNGILYENFSRLENIVDLKGTIPEVLFVASSFDSWHGLDLLLKSIRYSTREFVLHIVGQKISDDDMELIHGDSRIVLHGRLQKEEILELTSRCHVGIASLALYRVGMQEACTLKVREYLCNGIPVYSSHHDIFPESFPYYRCGDVDIDKIIDYAMEFSSVQSVVITWEADRYISNKRLLAELYGELGA